MIPLIHSVLQRCCMLRYAPEHFDKTEQQYYLSRKQEKATPIKKSRGLTNHIYIQSGATTDKQDPLQIIKGDKGQLAKITLSRNTGIPA